MRLIIFVKLILSRIRYHAKFQFNPSDRSGDETYFVKKENGGYRENCYSGRIFYCGKPPPEVEENSVDGVHGSFSCSNFIWFRVKDMGF